MMRVLIAFGSKRGGTAGLAVMIDDALTDAGHQAQVCPAGEVNDVADVDAVIVVGALYANRWHRDARRLVRRHRAALRRLPVWLVSSGPLDDSAAHNDIPPTKQVQEMARAVGARGHVTFGGRLAPDAKGLLAGVVAKNNAGDWRDRDHVRRWVHRHFAEVHSANTEPTGE
jgi:menaquinone-dependent protoporphyrinogen oxidase